MDDEEMIIDVGSQMLRALGYEVLLKEINPNTKVLLSSGYSIDGQAQEILESKLLYRGELLFGGCWCRPRLHWGRRHN